MQWSFEFLQENFFRNFGSILMFAFIGTTISAVGVGWVTILRTPEICPAYAFQVQCPRLHIFILGIGISGRLLTGVPDFRVDAVCH